MSRIILRLFTLVLACVGISSCNSAKSNQAESARIRAKLDAIPLHEKVQFTNDEWKYILTSLQYYCYVERGRSCHLPMPIGIRTRMEPTFAQHAAICCSVP